MSKKYKRSYKIYPAWDYQKEIENLNQASLNGWQLLKGGCFSSRFINNPDICYRYQMNYQKVEDMGRYIETFHEQGWEYINSTFNGWHYFRKIYDPALPKEEYEIFTDTESFREMNNRWTKLSLIIASIIGLLAIYFLIEMITRPHLSVLIQLLTLAIESVFLFYGGYKMKNMSKGTFYKNSRLLLMLFLAIIIIGCSSSITLVNMRTNFSCQTMSEELSEPMIDNRYNNFKVKYKDYYYIDLEMKAIESTEPLTFKIIKENDEIVYSISGTDITVENLPIKLEKDEYWCSVTAKEGFEIMFSIS